ncbi:c-type cytochrome biogenesis protein CcmI [Deefgea piscis]|uniref:c-type cytochrome biogenesis protein CcmI n=1 Tax=Deefgea piscis TaxID=2739061 RepID=UPI001C81791B|nr:c-type cytochrome biogenesis protein CcmI [Deefgea piscis]QZA81202.1 c-type cytochrome biogenesis protein CcmI [Deefgea piscis]
MTATNIGIFTLLCALLIVLCLLMLVWPLLRGRSAAGDIRRSRYALHATILEELDDDLHNGRLSQDDFESAKQEAEARLVAEVGRSDASSEQQKTLPANKIALILAIVLPLAAAGLYFQIGTPAALDPSTHQSPNVGPAEVDSMVKKLEARMALEPNDTAGWLMLARSYRAQARYTEAAQAYEKSWPLLEKDPGELARFAGVLAIENNGFTGRPTELLVKSLDLNASEPDALMLAGSAAVERGDYASAIRWWKQLLALLDPGSEDEVWLKGEIRTLQERQASSPTAAAHP